MNLEQKISELAAKLEFGDDDRAVLAREQHPRAGCNGPLGGEEGDGTEECGHLSE